MPEASIVTPEAAQHYRDGGVFVPRYGDLVHTVATEPDRTRAAVVKALRDAADYTAGFPRSGPDGLRRRADVIEKGADYA